MSVRCPSWVRPLIAATVAALGACYRPEFAQCLVRCASNGGCPSDLSCKIDGFCHEDGDQYDCRDNIVACGAEVCTLRGKNCGDVLDSCGELIACGECVSPEVCGGGGGANICGEGDCTPRTCADAMAMCGHPSDGCSGLLDCGGCTAPEACGAGGTNLTCGCGPIPYSEHAAHRMGHSQVFTGATMIIWGGRLGSDYYNDGAVYHFATQTWSELPMDASTPSARAGHSAVWTGTEMIVWGGHFGDGHHNDGARFSPATGKWTTLPTTNVPGPRAYHTAVWTGSRMLVWGGQFGQQDPRQDGKEFDPATNQWATLAISASTPSRRAGHSAIWTGTEMVIFGGILGSISGLFECGGSEIYRDGGRYNPATQAWTAIPEVATAPDYRTGHSAVWTGSRMAIWGGCNGSSYYNDGASLDLASGVWTPSAYSAACTPAHRAFHRAIWTGDDMLVWGGVAGSDYYNDGLRFGP